MPRGPRRLSDSGYYHVVVKGDGGQIIFESDADRRYYLRLLEECIDESLVDVHAYCLMSNHVHLVLEDHNRMLSSFVKHLSERYAMYFSKKTGRVGHVFQGRFWSEPIESDEYFLSAVRYVHKNPEVAGICAAREYQWSSFAAHMGQKSFVCRRLVNSLIGGPDRFAAFIEGEAPKAIPYSGSKLRGHLGPDEIARVAIMTIGEDILHGLKAMDTRNRLPYLRKLALAGFSCGEIARVTGIGKSSVHRMLSE